VVLKADGTVFSWGDDTEFGQLGNDSALVNQPTPVIVANATGIVSMALSYWHTLALKSDGTLQSWGNDADGQLGNDAALVFQPVPVPVDLGSSLIRL
jgi:alpha-tubulin suppressor-like RCC1 family protein